MPRPASSKNGAMNIKVGILAAMGSFAGSALGAHIVLLLSDEVLQHHDVHHPAGGGGAHPVAARPARTRTGTTAP
ncbi:MAG: hypothetical protein ACLR0S_00315 [Hominenteromicrobium sp.]|uniref:hypothetical protein n=1 Tax=Hominenteromicrobium sp. TaxID=3073581 RepID=UPI0039A31F05